MKNLVWILLLMVSINAVGQGLRTQGQIIVNAQGEEVLLRGLGPGGWLVMEGYMMQTSGVAGSQHEIKEKLIDLMGEENTEIFFNKWRENHFTKRDVDSLAAWGFNSIRLPMHYNLFTLPIEDEPVIGQNTWLETGFEIIDSLLAWCAPHDMYLILDMHAAPGGQGTGSEINDYDPSKPSLWESDANKDKLVALWARIAERYKDNEWIGGYDLINEPHWNLPGGTALRQLYERITQAIRAIDTTHILFIEGNWYANDFTGLTPPWDDNMAYSFHKYWSTNKDTDLDWVLPRREDNNVPLWMGESGENSNTWFTDAISLFESKNIGWAWWTIRKIGDIDSPYAVDINPGYQKVIDYWKGEGPRPTPEEAFDGMMQLCENLLVDNSRYRKDVPDAMFRQVATDETIPYSHHTIPGVVYMPDFDLGKNEFAYYDVDVADYNLSTGFFQAWNSGWSYRNDGVDIEKNDDEINSNGFHIGFVHRGEWTNYTVQILESGEYSAQVRVASQQSDGEFHLSLDGEAITSTHAVTSTGGWTDFVMYEITGIRLTAGEHTLTMNFDNDVPFNVSSVEFIRTGGLESIPFSAINGETGGNAYSITITSNFSLLVESIGSTTEDFTVKVNGEERTTTSLSFDDVGGNVRTIRITMDDPMVFTDEITVSYSGSSITSVDGETLPAFSDLPVVNLLPTRHLIPGKIEAEDFVVADHFVLEDAKDIGGTRNLGYTDVGDFADYDVFVEEASDYTFYLRVAAQSREGEMGFYLVDEQGEESLLFEETLPSTGGWQTWVTDTAEAFIPAGIHTLRMKVLRSGFNFNWFRVETKIPLGALEERTSLLVYPNPARNSIQVQSDEYDRYTIITLSGSRLEHGVIPESRIIDLNKFDAGLYILKMINSSSGKTVQTKLILNK